MARLVYPIPAEGGIWPQGLGACRSQDRCWRERDANPSSVRLSVRVARAKPSRRPLVLSGSSFARGSTHGPAPTARGGTRRGSRGRGGALVDVSPNCPSHDYGEIHQRMQILNVTHQSPPAVGGSEEHVADLSAELAARGHRIDVYTWARIADVVEDVCRPAVRARAMRRGTCAYSRRH